VLKVRDLLLTSSAALVAMLATREATRAPSPESYARAMSVVFQDVSRELAPSVVGVESFSSRGASRSRAQGTGVIIDSDGTIVTNNHVVRGGRHWSVALHDGTRHDAELVGRDPETDLAVLKIDAPGLKAARLQTNVEVGEWVLAMGNPYGLQHSVTAGIISAKERKGLDIATYESFLQTDAEIHPGNSGGPLVNLDGEVVGINTAVAEVGSNPIGFAIPSAMVEPVVKTLARHGEVVRGYLGINMAELTEEARERFDLLGRGVVISNVKGDTPAERAGLLKGDVILSVGGTRVGSSHELLNAIALYRPGASAELEIWRSGDLLKRAVQFADRPDPEELLR